MRISFSPHHKMAAHAHTELEISYFIELSQLSFDNFKPTAHISPGPNLAPFDAAAGRRHLVLYALVGCDHFFMGKSGCKVCGAGWLQPPQPNLSRLAPTHFRSYYDSAGFTPDFGHFLAASHILFCHQIVRTVFNYNFC